jgi:phosphatidylglycerophosphate synthase
MKGKERIINIPNAMTFLRLLLIIPFGVLVSLGKLPAALFLFALIALMDKLDGWLARITNQRTNFGELFDSSADWMIIAVSIGLGIFFGHIPSFFAMFLAILLAFFIVLKIFYVKRSGKTSSTWWGKATVVSSYLVVFAYLTDFRYAIAIYWGCVATCFISLLLFFFKSLKN